MRTRTNSYAKKSSTRQRWVFVDISECFTKRDGQLNRLLSDFIETKSIVTAIQLDDDMNRAGFVLWNTRFTILRNRSENDFVLIQSTVLLLLCNYWRFHTAVHMGVGVLFNWVQVCEWWHNDIHRSTTGSIQVTVKIQNDDFNANSWFQLADDSCGISSVWRTSTWTIAVNSELYGTYQLLRSIHPIKC